jgi:hypothetical protein
MNINSKSTKYWMMKLIKNPKKIQLKKKGDGIFFLKKNNLVLLLNWTQHVNFETSQSNSLPSPSLEFTHTWVDSI